MVSTEFDVDRAGFFWNMLRKHWSQAVVDSVQGLRLLSNKRGCVFDVDRRFLSEIETIGRKVSSNKLCIYQPNELPELEERQNNPDF